MREWRPMCACQGTHEITLIINPLSIQQPDEPDAYACECPLGFLGSHCQYSISQIQYTEAKRITRNLANELLQAAREWTYCSEQEIVTTLGFVDFAYLRVDDRVHALHSYGVGSVGCVIGDGGPSVKGASVTTAVHYSRLSTG
ncbi:unnamed protein product [Sphagnum balticum]